jgi:hypothetical protein
MQHVMSGLRTVKSEPPVFFLDIFLLDVLFYFWQWWMGAMSTTD